MHNHEPRSLSGLASHYLGDLAYGANDGVITTFAVVACVSGASLPARIVLILGLRACLRRRRRCGGPDLTTNGPPAVKAEGPRRVLSALF